jgi:hypothetical protein
MRRVYDMFRTVTPKRALVRPARQWVRMMVAARVHEGEAGCALCDSELS